MAAAKWIRPSAETVAHFERIAPGPPLQIRRMFGMPCRFLNGHMLVGVYQNSIMLHLSVEDRAACIEAGARPLITSGRELKEYVEILPGTFDDHTLKLWIVQGMRYLGSLPPNLSLEMTKPASGRRLKLDSPARPRSGSGAAAPSRPAAKRARAKPPAHPPTHGGARKTKKTGPSNVRAAVRADARKRPRTQKPAAKPGTAVRKRSR